ncbi:hypothetical protein H6800_01560 [Candidatus Nomurabacteria bacterium]|nr:hypothetical protein [Candidatus Nomurabacteria bacterium]
MVDRAEPIKPHSSEPARRKRVVEKIGDTLRHALGTALMQPDGYLYPGDVREKAGDILSVVPTLGRISTATASDRHSIVDDYAPEQVTHFIRESEQSDWTVKPGFYQALASRVAESGTVDRHVAVARTSKPKKTTKKSTQKRRRKKSNLRLVKFDPDNE